MIELNTAWQDGISTQIQRIRRELRGYPERAVVEYRKLTPKQSGNAQRRTRLVGRERIVLDYPYAEVLDRGRQVQSGQIRGSDQAPQGMTQPFTQWIRQQMNRIFRG